MPAAPGFYNHPVNIHDLFEQISSRAVSFLVPDKGLVDTYIPRSGKSL
jgi:3-polyprenyl-4-hydroxybenzoate decarboxylase